MSRSSSDLFDRIFPLLIFLFAAGFSLVQQLIELRKKISGRRSGEVPPERGGERKVSPAPPGREEESGGVFQQIRKALFREESELSDKAPEPLAPPPEPAVRPEPLARSQRERQRPRTDDTTPREPMAPPSVTVSAPVSLRNTLFTPSITMGLRLPPMRVAPSQPPPISLRDPTALRRAMIAHIVFSPPRALDSGYTSALPK